MVVQINLGLLAYLDGLIQIHIMVGLVVVHRAGHHVFHAVVVGHGDGHRIGEGLAQIALGVVGHIILVLIEVHRRVVVDVGQAVLVGGGIVLVFIDFPSATQDFVGSLGDKRLVEAHTGTGQHSRGLQQLTDGGHTTLKVDVDVDDVALAYLIVAGTRLVGLDVGVYILSRNHLVLLQIVDVHIAHHKEGAGGRRHLALDFKVGLLVL